MILDFMPNGLSVEQVLANASSGSSRPLIPAGKYVFRIVNSELKKTKNDGGRYVFTCVVASGQYQGTEFSIGLNFVNENKTAVTIAYETYARICHALGEAVMVQDTTKLHNKLFQADVEVKQGDVMKDKETGEIRYDETTGEPRRYSDYSEIKERTISAAPSVNQAAPVMSQPVLQPQVAVSAAPAAQASAPKAKMPWEA